MVGVLALAAALRLTALMTFGLNSDEAVYAGQAAAIARDPQYAPLFPIFRAHPLLFQVTLSVFFQFGVSDLAGRILSALAGVLTVYLVYRLGHELFGEKEGIIAAVFLALMPYHVAISRQALLDGPMTLFVTMSAFFLARYAVRARPYDLYAAGGALGLAFLSKETGILWLGAAYSFIALSPAVTIRLRDLAISAAIAFALYSLYPLSLLLAGSGAPSTVRQYLVWQFLRDPNHAWDFYLRTALIELGVLLVFLALLGILRLRRTFSWRETLLACWIFLPILFFQAWPTKGYPYLLPIAPPLAILAARGLAGWFLPAERNGSARKPLSLNLLPFALIVVAFSLFIPSSLIVFPKATAGFLAGSGGIPGGRETGEWIGENLPEGASLMTIGPSMANILQFYGHRMASGLSVSANPLYRNPAYRPIDNPDNQIRLGEIQYLVWDAYSSGRSEFFSEKLLEYVHKYGGRVVHIETIPIETEGGEVVAEPVIIVYRVYP